MVTQESCCPHGSRDRLQCPDIPTTISLHLACLLIHLCTHPLRLYPADLDKGMTAVLGFQARVLQACCHPLCCTPCNLACSLKSRDESGSSSDITRISFAASLAPCLWDGCHLPLLVLLGEPGSSETAFPLFLPPASWHITGRREAIGFHWER